MKRRTKYGWLLLVIIASMMVTACGSNNGNGNEDAGGEAAKTMEIGIIQLVEHPSLDAAREGFEAALEDAGYKDGAEIKIDFQNAQGDPTNNVTIAQKFAADDKDLVLAIATSSAQAVKKMVDNAPILFTAITDPLGSNLVGDLEAPEGSITGMSDTHQNEIEEMMTFIAENVPSVKTVGIVFNEGEQNSVVAVERVEQSLEQLGIELKTASVVNSSEVKQAAESLASKVDAFYVPKDNVVVAGLEALLKVAGDEDLPVFAGEKNSVERGAFASFSIDYFDIGYETGKMAVEILKNGKQPADLPVRFPEKLDLVLNLKAAEEQGIEVSKELLDKVEEENLIK
ncbi:ABC transporter substrate-binding protein [Marinicrinis sediminis]|uniref:ABC transporter substrate-binding protein n=1 Tax=Marinicrinis sediminis TaxID=1652465 RepID=A0ABW5REI1_9BACL